MDPPGVCAGVAVPGVAVLTLTPLVGVVGVVTSLPEPPVCVATKKGSAEPGRGPGVSSVAEHCELFEIELAIELLLACRRP